MPDAVQTGGAGLSAFVPLAVELCDLKRVRDATSPDSLASRAFRAAWAASITAISPATARTLARSAGTSPPWPATELETSWSTSPSARVTG